jgi:putative ABC transport system substrate-binding protein
VIGLDALFTSRRLQMATLATRHATPAIYVGREFPEAGGLMGYGTSLTEVYRQLGAYAGRILKATRRPSYRSCSRRSSSLSST